MRDFILDKSHYTLPNYRQKSTRTPYPFQQDAFNALDKLKKNNPDGYASMLVLPTGAGKTYTAAKAAKTRRSRTKHPGCGPRRFFPRMTFEIVTSVS